MIDPLAKISSQAKNSLDPPCLCSLNSRGILPGGFSLRSLHFAMRVMGRNFAGSAWDEEKLWREIFLEERVIIGGGKLQAQVAAVPV